MTRAELESYVAALDFLWTLRNQLHLTTGRTTDQMTFDLQERVAADLAYEDPDAVELPVERFMGAYYRRARVIQNFSNLLLELALRTARGSPLEPARSVEEGFRVADDHLEIPDDPHLRQRPVRLLESFAVAQEHDVALSREARRHLRENLDLAREGLRSDPEAGACLDRILASEQRVARTLVAMNETGLLGAWIPEWEHIVCRWQQVTYHTYTVDVHSIFVVEELRRLWQGKYATGLPELTELMQGVRDRSVLFLGCLFHDIGKGLGGDHSIKGGLRGRPQGSCALPGAAPPADVPPRPAPRSLGSQADRRVRANGGRQGEPAQSLPAHLRGHPSLVARRVERVEGPAAAGALRAHLGVPRSRRRPHPDRG
jgi:[protein-PII] uridylyltransferase